MGKLKFSTSLLLLVTTPTMLMYPQDVPGARFQTQRADDGEKRTEINYSLSYDDMLRFLNEIESGELESKCTFEESEKIKHWVAFLAKAGALPDNSEESLSLDDDIEELLNCKGNIYEDALFFVAPGEYQYPIFPAVFTGHGDVVLCKSWLTKQWKHVKHFIKKHKKELFIGAAVVVGSVVVVVAVAAVGTAATSAAAAGAASVAGAASSSDHHSNKDQKEESSSASAPVDVSPEMTTIQESPILKSAIDHQISSFKESITQNPSIGEQGLSWEENARALGSLFAHDSYNNIQHQIPYHPGLSQEINEIYSKYAFSISEGNREAGHSEIDQRFSTDYSHLFSNPGQEGNVNSLAYQVLGERALAFGCYNQAIQDLGKAIETNPTNPIPYLERGIAHFGLGQYESSLEDYRQFTDQAQKIYPLSVSEFSLGFAKGLPKGAYESGEGLVLFLADFVKHPIHTSGQVVDSVTTLVNLVRNDEWGVIGESLSPEIHQLVTQWDTLPSDKRGELAGYAVGKHGADILVPGALAKIASKSVKSARELASVCKNLQLAQETLILETAAEIGNSVKIAEVIQSKAVALAERLGFNTCEIAQLENIGKMEGSINNIAKNAPNVSQDINFANHALQRAVERGVSKESILDALASPLKIEEVKIDNLGRPSQRFIGQKAEVVINPETQQVVSVNPTSTKKLEKLNNELSNVRDRAE